MMAIEWRQTSPSAKLVPSLTSSLFSHFGTGRTARIPRICGQRNGIKEVGAEIKSVVTSREMRFHERVSTRLSREKSGSIKGVGTFRGSSATVSRNIMMPVLVRGM